MFGNSDNDAGAIGSGGNAPAPIVPVDDGKGNKGNSVQQPGFFQSLWNNWFMFD